MALQSGGDNFGGTQQYPVFKQIEQAANATMVAAGDTLYIEGSVEDYNGATIQKRLVIIGAGYLLDENPNSSVLPHQTRVFSISFSPTASGSEVMGVWLSAGVTSASIASSNVTVKRCRIQGQIGLSSTVFNVRIIQNFFSNSSQSNAITAIATPYDIVFNNNIVRCPLSDPDILFSEIKNNVFDPPTPAGSNVSIRVNTSSFQNNILKNPAATVIINNGNTQDVMYNTGASASQFGTANNNIVANMAALFVDPAPNSTDGDYQLKPGSTPGSDGAERGAFGGAIPTARYSLSGLAPIPVIYSLQTSGVATSTGMPVNLKARTIQ
ncbi:MAG: hypothetical protein NVV59_18825 [Chitinophagaceae bacterium]|nr:hypothetical protein [Chitinophagaceae bacterium]